MSKFVSPPKPIFLTDRAKHLPVLNAAFIVHVSPRHFLYVRGDAREYEQFGIDPNSAAFAKLINPPVTSQKMETEKTVEAMAKHIAVELGASPPEVEAGERLDLARVAEAYENSEALPLFRLFWLINIDPPTAAHLGEANDDGRLPEVIAEYGVEAEHGEDLFAALAAGDEGDAARERLLDAIGREIIENDTIELIW
jgi:hypothetical protein